MACSQRHRWRRLKTYAYSQHGDIVSRARPDESGFVVASIAEPHYRLAGILDNVKVSDDVSGIVPYEAGTGAARHREHVACPKVSHQRLGSNEDNRTARSFKQFNCRFLIGGQIAAGHNGARRRIHLRRKPIPDVGEASPEQYQQNAGKDNPKNTGDRPVLHWFISITNRLKYYAGSCKKLNL